MSWLRSAVNKAVIVGGRNSLTSTVRSYADSVVQQAGQAVAGGAKLFQDRLLLRNFQSFKQAVKRLEEVSVSCRGTERVQLLRRWLVALKEIERLSAVSSDDGKNSEQNQISDGNKGSPRKPTMVLYYDPKLGEGPMNFRDVFLCSEALEGITLSMILEAPTEEELSLLLEIFGLCLTGGKEIHEETLHNIKELAKAFSNYDDEVLGKKEEMLGYAQGAMAGLKVNVDITRIDCEISNIHQSLEEIRSHNHSNEGEGKSDQATVAEAPEEAFAEVQLCARLEALLLKKKLIKNGDSPDLHAHKVDKLKVLSESLGNSAVKAERRISDHRAQQEDALNFRVNKASELSQFEKDTFSEIRVFENRRDELEAELEKVNSSLAAARARLHNAQEEREQFDEASNQILLHLKSKDDELSRSIESYRAEARVCNAFIHFLEKTWDFQSLYVEQKKKQVNDELEKFEETFVNLAIRLLSSYKDDLGPSISVTRKLVDNLKGLEKGTCEDETLQAITSRKNLEEEYLALEVKFLTTFSVVKNIRKHFSNPQDKEISRNGDKRLIELIGTLQDIKDEFDSIQRPTLEIENPQTDDNASSKEEGSEMSSSLLLKMVSKSESVPNEVQPTEFGTPTQRVITPLKQSPQKSLFLTLIKSNETPQKIKGDEFSESPPIQGGKADVDADAQLSKLKLELEYENDTRDCLVEEISEWEFDGKDLKHGELSSST